jgi:hypothetical protein|tara:strand:+ start:318 stop:500 length:183 start_codon:yes stop_codon:yes gene_type:complete
MSITSAQYIQSPLDDPKVNRMIKATINGQEWFVSINTDNRHYREILEQVKEGKLTIKDAD